MIIKSGVTPGGVRYDIDDTYIALPGSDEEHRIVEEQRKIAFDILAHTQNSISA